MMDEPVISLGMIRAKARAAFNRGAGRDDHNFNWHSTAAIAAYQAEWDACSAAQQQNSEWAAGELTRMLPP